MTTPTIGRIVHYKLSETDAAQINKRRHDFNKHWSSEEFEPVGFQAHMGNRAEAGQVYPAMIVRTWGNTPEASVQLQVFLDGNDTFWATSVAQGEGERQYVWPQRA
jgi:hypothetical protein